MKSEITDLEFHSDKQYLDRYAADLSRNGYRVETRVGFGNPKKAIPQIVKEFGAELLVMGAHGHKGWKDFLLGTTVDAVRHRVEIPVLIVTRKS
jgi:manganese transport protein